MLWYTDKLKSSQCLKIYGLYVTLELKKKTKTALLLPEVIHLLIPEEYKTVGMNCFPKA